MRADCKAKIQRQDTGEDSPRRHSAMACWYRSS